MGDDKVSLRRYEDDLNVGGLGVVALGAWDALKFIMHTIIAAKDEINLEEFAQDDRPGVMGVMIVVMVLMLLVVLLIFKLYLYIGLNASKAARWEPYKKGYYKGAVILPAGDYYVVAGVLPLCQYF